MNKRAADENLLCLIGEVIVETAAGTDDIIEDEVDVVVEVVEVMEEVVVVAMLKYFFSRVKYLSFYTEVDFIYI